MSHTLRDREAGHSFLVGDLAARAGVSPDTVRYYERLGLLDTPQRTESGYRLYDVDAIDRVGFVRKAQTLGLTLREIGEIIQASLDDAPPCEHVRTTLSSRLDDVERRLSDLRALRTTLRQALRRADDLPLVPSCLCGIIESQPLPEDQS